MGVFDHVLCPAGELRAQGHRAGAVDNFIEGYVEAHGEVDGDVQVQWHKAAQDAADGGSVTAGPAAERAQGNVLVAELVLEPCGVGDDVLRAMVLLQRKLACRGGWGRKGVDEWRF